MDATGEWRKRIKEFNLNCLDFIREAGADDQKYVMSTFRLDNPTLKLLMSMTMEEMTALANVALPLFRLKLDDLSSFINLHKKGNGDRAAALLVAGLLAGGGKEAES
jgi:hypothetical protein